MTPQASHPSIPKSNHVRRCGTVLNPYTLLLLTDYTLNFVSEMSLSVHEIDPSRHRRYSCDELLATAAARGISDSDESDTEPADPEGLLGQESPFLPEEIEIVSRTPRRQLLSLERRAFFIRTLALLCVCSLSVGSHYASYILGPLKSRLAREIGTSHTDFGLLIAALSLNSTWTPLVGGMLASTLGTTLTSILATGVIFSGQLLLLIGDIWGDVRLMVLGLFVFGLGVSPLAVVQETMIVRFFKSHGLGVSMAFGLIAGKGASFMSASTSYPLTERFGPRAPFYVATFLAGLSVVVNLVYVAASKWLVDGAGAELEAPDIREEAHARLMSNISEAQALEKVAAKRRVNLPQITKLGDVFWAYIGLNILCGMIWSPFTHLAANIIENRYGMSEENAAIQASYLLAGSLILYPICGFLVDRFKHRPIVVLLLVLSSSLTLAAYAWFALPPSWTKIAGPAIALFGAGHGFAPLLLVVLVPKIVPLKYVSTALGAHKSLEQTGSTIFQTLAGLVLDIRKGSGSKGSTKEPQPLLNIFFLLNALQLASILAVAQLQRRKRRAAIVKQQRRTSQVLADEDEPLISPSECHSRYLSTGSGARPITSRVSPTEIRRGKVFALLCAVSIASAWILFLGTAWMRLGSKRNHRDTLKIKFGLGGAKEGDWVRVTEIADGTTQPSRKMGAYKYIGELYKKKQSDVLRFLLRVRCWEYRQLNVIHRASRPSRPDKARRLGYKAKQGFVIYRVRVRRGNRKKHAPKGATYGKPVRHGVNQLKFQRGLRSTAEERVGKRCGNLRVLNSYWVNQDGVYKYYEVILVDPSHKAIRRDPRINWIANPVHKRREARGLTSIGKQNRGLGKGHLHNHTPARSTWKKHNTLSLRRYR
ncbi:60S ribosomal protein L15 [Hypsizygus marmoreus]|uniref:Ribosomal protein L15 n=1 Tax=Hypsizygus marmoreus TaxID=39966 RepID=A0A369K9P8_HYPMA|nr:60S ribosomal protein L15 [Hypsizygus marmoreus]